MSKKGKPPLARLVLGLDPAKAAGAALFLDGELIGYSAADGSTWRTYEAVVRSLFTPAAALVPEPERLAIIEDGFIGQSYGKGVLTLGRRRGLAQAAAEANGFTRIVFAPVPRWMIEVHGSIYKKDTKELSLQLAKDRYGVVGQPDDVTDSVLLGAWGIASQNR